MKKRISFTKFLHSDKLMMFISLLLAIVIWFSVLVGPANVADRVLTVKITVTLDNNSYEGQRGLRVLGQNEFEVQVSVRGRWSIISRLSGEDLRATPNLSAIIGPGNVSVPISVDYNSDITNYEIVSWSPRLATVECDYWQEGTTFKVEADVSALKVSDPETAQIGEPVIDQSAFPSGVVTIDGPKTVLSQIARVVARVDTEQTLSVTTQMDVPLVALNDKGEMVDLSSCTIKEVPGGIVKMTVPIWQDRRIKLGYTLVNVPSGVDPDQVLKLEPSEIEVLGPAAELDAIEAQLKNLGTVDFRTLSIDHPTVSFPLSLPMTVRAVESPEAAVLTLDTAGLAQKTISVEASQKNVIVNGLASGQSATVTPHTFENMILVGDESAINAISAAAISFEVTVAETPDRKAWYTPQIKVNLRDDVWVYMSDALSAERIYIEIK